LHRFLSGPTPVAPRPRRSPPSWWAPSRWRTPSGLPPAPPAPPPQAEVWQEDRRVVPPPIYLPSSPKHPVCASPEGSASGCHVTFWPFPFIFPGCASTEGAAQGCSTSQKGRFPKGRGLPLFTGYSALMLWFLISIVFLLRIFFSKITNDAPHSTLWLLTVPSQSEFCFHSLIFYFKFGYCITSSPPPRGAEGFQPSSQLEARQQPFP